MTDESALRESRGAAVRIRFHASAVLLVAAGGFLGTIARYLIDMAMPQWRGIPLGILVINLIGAFLLGLLIETLVRSGPDSGWRRRLRFFAGAGILGGFTTYSALATDTARLLDTGSVGLALVYGLGTVLAGALATAAGIWLARTVFRPSRGR